MISVLLALALIVGCGVTLPAAAVIYLDSGVPVFSEELDGLVGGPGHFIRMPSFRPK